jgi:2-keto-4-pentenoate hydratase/2-oxohepta-3-ene-1,7-dioic acid hydratase in catechol pathway
MRLVSFHAAGALVSGIDLGSHVADTQATARLAGWQASDAALLASNRNVVRLPADRMLSLDQTARQHLEALIAAGHAFPGKSVRLGPPIPDPEKIICLGLNYHDHAREVGAKLPSSPMFFAKYANSLIGPADDIVPPRGAARIDYEAELAVVIGRPGRYIKSEDALGHVAGLMAFNDVSARDLQLANQLWTGGKAIDTFAPCGPALVTTDEFANIQSLSIITRIDGVKLQDGNTSSMIFQVADTIAFLSRIMTLSPGDIIATGTPAGVAGSHHPPRFLKPGDIVEVEVDGIGRLRNMVKAPC